jgi:hypothetical protein
MFAPISIEHYVQKHLRSNPDEKPEELRARLRECVAAALGGERCECGEPLWAPPSQATPASRASPVKRRPVKTTKSTKCFALRRRGSIAREKVSLPKPL